MNRFLITFLGTTLAAGNAFAQAFSAEDLARPQKVGLSEVETEIRTDRFQTTEKSDNAADDISRAFLTTQAGAEDGRNADDPLAQISEALKTSAEGGVLAGEESKNPEAEDIFIPEGELYRLNTPTLDGSVRGGQAFVEVDEKGRMKKVSNIFLYYDQFKILNYLSDTPSCDVRFNVLSNLDQKINRLDVKLVWPDLTTTLSFSDVQPNTQTYYNYSLLGKGCYNMDKAPNIIVNRCRVKGMTASECANKLVWLTK